jgi:hypothetical protein
VAEIRRVRVDQLVLSGIPREQQTAVVAALESALRAGLADAKAINPQSPRAPLGWSVDARASGKALGTAAGHAIARTVTGETTERGRR